MEDLLYLRMNKQRLMYALVLHENAALQVEWKYVMEMENYAAF